jgi:hypothetical protein
MIEPTTVTGQSGDDDRSDRLSRLSQVFAWVGVIAGVVFVVAVIFFSGFFLGWSSGDDDYGWHRGHGGWHRGYGGWPPDTCPMMGPGGMTGPGGMMGPGGMGPGGPMGPQQSPTTTPSTPHP